VWVTATSGTKGPRRIVFVVAGVVACLVLAITALWVVTHRRTQLPTSIYGTTERTEPALTRSVPAPPSDLVTIYGANGTFGDAARSPNHPATVAIDGWSFEPGASAFFSAVTSNGRVLIGTVPQTDNQTAPTGTTMSVGVFDPAASTGPRFTSLRIPTSGGVESTTSVGRDVGGADVSDLCPVATSDGARVMGISSVPYKFWELTAGEFPAVVSFLDDDRRPGASAVAVDKARTHPPDDLRRTDAGRAALPVGAGDPDVFPSASGFTECDTLPGGDVVVTQYFPPVGRHAGGLVVVDPSGAAVAFLQLEETTVTAELTVAAGATTARVPSGTVVTLSPREVRADPHTMDRRDQRFVIVFDAGADVDAVDGGTKPGTDGHVRLPEMFQEFRYDADRHRIEPTSPVLVMRDDQPVNRPPTDLVYAFTTAYAPDGTLFVTRSHAGSLLSASTAVFRPGSLGTRTTTPAPLGAEVTADATLASFDGATVRSPSGQHDFGATFSINYDAAHQRLVQVSAGNALLRSVRWAGWDVDDPGTTADGSLCQVDLGGRALSEANKDHRYQSRQGAIDPANRILYLSYQGLQSTEPPKANAVIPQFLFAVNLDRLAECRP